MVVPVCHPTRICCVYGMVLYWPILQSYVCVHVSCVCRYVAPPVECYYNTILCCDDYFSSSSVTSRAFSALWVYSKCGHNPHPLGYICAKFRFFRGLHCWAGPWRKIAYSLTHSVTHPAYLMPREPKLALRNLHKSCSLISIMANFSWWWPHMTLEYVLRAG